MLLLYCFSHIYFSGSFSKCTAATSMGTTHPCLHWLIANRTTPCSTNSLRYINNNYREIRRQKIDAVLLIILFTHFTRSLLITGSREQSDVHEARPRLLSHHARPAPSSVYLAFIRMCYVGLRNETKQNKAKKRKEKKQKER